MNTEKRVVGWPGNVPGFLLLLLRFGSETRRSTRHKDMKERKKRTKKKVGCLCNFFFSSPSAASLSAAPQPLPCPASWRLHVRYRGGGKKSVGPIRRRVLRRGAGLCPSHVGDQCHQTGSRNCVKLQNKETSENWSFVPVLYEVSTRSWEQIQNVKCRET